MKNISNKSQKICFIDQTAALGGAELCLLDIATSFRNRCKVILFHDGPFRNRLEERGVEVVIIDAPIKIRDIKRKGRLLSELRAIPDIIAFALKICRELADSDIIFVNTQKALVVGCVASVLSRKPLVWYLHDVITADHFGPRKRLISVFLANHFAKGTIANSKASRDSLYAGGGNVNKRIEVVANGIHGEPFKSSDPVTTRKLRAELGINGSPVIGIFSRLAPWKGQHVLLEALRKLPDVKALVVGDALFSGEKAYEEQLRKFAQEHGLADRVHFLGFRHDIPALMHVSDIVVHASIAPEPFGRVIVEGMLAGKPVIATRCGGPMEIIEDMRTGILVTPNDSTALVAAINLLLSNPEAALSMGHQAREKALSAYSVEYMNDCIKKEIERILNRQEDEGIMPIVSDSAERKVSGPQPEFPAR